MMVDTTRRGTALGALAVLLGLVFSSPVEGGLDSLVGTRVVPRSGVMLRQDDGRLVDANRGHSIFLVDQASEEWLYLVSEGQTGWARPADVITLDRAMDYYTGEIHEHPDFASAYIMRGLLYEELKEPGIALADYNEALRIDPNDALAHLRRGVIRAAHKHDAERAIADFSEAIRIDPNLAQAHAQRAHVRREQQEFELAIADYTRALRLEPKDVLCYHGRAIAWQGKGDAEQALRDYDEVIKLAPNDPVAYLNRGNLWSEKHDYDKAIAEYTQAIRLDKKYVPAYNNRGIAWRAQKEYDKAVSDHNIATRLAPNDPSGYLDRGIVWKKLGEFERALDDYNQALRLDPKCAEAYNGRAWVQATCPDAQYRDGRAAYEAAVRSCELTGWKAANHLDTLAAAYAESRDFQRAIEWESKALERADDAQKESFHARLQVFQAKKPYRDAPVTPAVAAQTDDTVQPAALPQDNP